MEASLTIEKQVLACELSSGKGRGLIQYKYPSVLKQPNLPQTSPGGAFSQRKIVQ